MVDPSITAGASDAQAREKAAATTPGVPVDADALEGKLSAETLRFLTGASGGPIGELWGGLGDRMRLRRWRRALERADRAAEILRERQQEPRRVPDNTLIPALEAASLAEDDALALRWERLLANAADPTRDEVRPDFAVVLSQLTPDDAALFDFIIAYARANPDISATAATLDPIIVLKQGPVVDPRQFWISLDGLLRARLVLEKPYEPPEARGSVGATATAATRVYLATTSGMQHLRVTNFGVAFAEAVRA